MWYIVGMKRKRKNICGLTIKALRLKRGLTQLELSKKLSDLHTNIDRAGVAKIETGARYVLDYELVGMIVGRK